MNTEQKQKETEKNSGLSRLSSENRKRIRNIVYSALFLAAAFILPMLTGQIPQIGQALLPMHLPVLLCGFICGWQYGAAVGFIAPLMRSVIFSMPPMPAAAVMAFEMAAYGAVTGILNRIFPKKPVFIYVNLIISMLAGRAVWGAGKFIMSGINKTEFPFSAFLAGAFTNAIPGIILQIVLVPVLVMLYNKFSSGGRNNADM